MSQAARAPVPASLKKQIGRYLMAAKSFKKLSPVTALYCKLYALEIAKSQFNNDTRAYILQLADDCIAEKDILNPTPEDAKKAIRSMGSNIFKNIYPNESSMTKKQAAKGYRDCFVCFEILKHPNLKDTMTDGELEIYAQNTKYLTFKAASVLNPSIIKDNPPEPPPALQKLIEMDESTNDNDNNNNEDDDDALLKELEAMEMDTSNDPWASFNSSQNNNKFDQKLADAKENELNNINNNNNDSTNDSTNDTTNSNDNSNNNNNNNNNTNYNNNNNNNYNSNYNNNNMGNMGNMGGNPYYGGGGGGNPYYGGGGGGYSDPNATMGSANNNNNNNAEGGDGGEDDGLGDLPEPPSNKNNNNNNEKPVTRKQPSYKDLTKPLPNAKYEDNSSNENLLGNVSKDGVDYSSYLNGFSETKKMWVNVKNGQKLQKQCGQTLDQAVYCLMLGEPDFRGALDIAGRTEKMINLCRKSIGLQQINLPSKPPNDIPSDNAGGKTNDWWGKPIGTKKFFRFQELSFEAEARLKKVKRHIGRSEMPSMETFIMLAEAMSFLQPIANIQPAWEQ